jgi:hypothetical protein
MATTKKGDITMFLKPLLMLAVIATLVIATHPIRPAFAHHSWASSDTRYAYYVTGTVTDVRWGNPHVEVRLRLDRAAVPQGLTQRALPQGADAQDGRDALISARAYTGDLAELDLTLAPPDWMERWGLHRRLKEGEHIEAVGFLSVNGGDEFRPVMFWLSDGQGVWQKLLPFPHRPEPAPAASR